MHAYLLATLLFAACLQQAEETVDQDRQGFRLNRQQEAFLEDLEQRCFRYFWEQADENTGLVADRARVDGSSRNRRGSIAAVGFGLTALCIADYRGWVSHEEAYQRAVNTLRWLAEHQPHVHGFFFHFVDIRNGKRLGRCELSSIDTALCLAGVLTCRTYWKGTPAEEYANQIYRRVDWPWMLNGGNTLSMGWLPESGFLKARWARFCEHPFMYLMAIGSPTHPIPPECWDAWERKPVVTYAGYTFMQSPSLFTHQYPHAWVDFRGKRDRYADYFENSVAATLAQRQFCIDQRHRFPSWGENMWGLSACDAPEGYRGGYGGPPVPRNKPFDGLLVPCAVAGSLPFAPRECLDTLLTMKKLYGDKIYGYYGFCDSFNPETGWVSSDVIGIDVGITLLMAENLRSGFVWKYFMANEEITEAMKKVGFVGVSRSVGK